MLTVSHGDSEIGRPARASRGLLVWFSAMLVLSATAGASSLLGIRDARIPLLLVVISGCAVVVLVFRQRSRTWVGAFAATTAFIVVLGVLPTLTGSWHWFAAQGAIQRGDYAAASSHLDRQAHATAGNCIRLPQVGDTPGVRVCRCGLVVCSDTWLSLEQGRALGELGRKEDAIALLRAAAETAREEGYRDQALEDMLTMILAEMLRLGAGE